MRSLTLLAAAAGLLLTSSIALRAQTISSASLRLSNSGVADAALANSGFVAPAISIANVEDRHEQRLKCLWITSIFAMAAGTGADAATSWHKKESNPLLASSDGTFGAKGIGIKAGVAGGVLLPQILFHKNKDLRTAFTIGNLAQAGLFSGIAIHNAGIAAPQK